MTITSQIAELIVKGKTNDLKILVQKAVADGIEPKDILNDGLIAGMSIVGDKFKNQELYVPEVLLSARAMKAALAIIQPKLVSTGVEPKGKIVIGTVKGDLHDIGKNLVGMMMEGAGFKVIDLGSDVDPEKFVNVAEENHASLIGLSALLTTTMMNMKQVVDKVKERSLNIKVIVGGAPLSSEFANSIGADGFSPDAPSAVELAVKLAA